MYFVCHAYYILYSYNKGSQRKSYRIKNSVRKKKYIYSPVLYLLKKKSVYKWMCAGQTCVVQRSTIFIYKKYLKAANFDEGLMGCQSKGTGKESSGKGRDG